MHIADDTGRIAMYEKRTSGSDGSAETLQRYIYSNHLSTASLELDDTAAIISYEEYHPYGTTAYQAMNASINAVAKRYRYTGKERDEETGLYYHGARYYLPWLCKWMACDPINSEFYNVSKGNPGKNRERDFLELCASTHEYSYDNPVRFLDSTGEQPTVKTIKTSTGTYTSSPEKLQQARDQNKDPSLRIIDVLLPDSTRQNPPSGSTPDTNGQRPPTRGFDPRYNPPPGKSITTNLVVDFPQNSSKIHDTKQAIRNIEPIIEALKGNPKLSITLSGNTAYPKSQKNIQEDGNLSTPEQLMEHRAAAIKNLMIKEGVNPAQIKTSPGKPESTINATGTIKNNEKKID